MSKIVLTNVDKFYGKNHVLKNLNLTIEDGDFMTLLGPSGCGKTTTLPYLAFQYQNQNCPQASNCVAIMMFSIVFLVYALANIFGDADLAKSMAG